VEVGSANELVVALETIKQGAAALELNNQITISVVGLKSGFQRE
jgi:hypothetical protein